VKTKTRKALRTIALACVAAVVWNFVPFWLVKDSLSAPWRALWVWGVFPLSIPIFYAFLDRYWTHPSERDCADRNLP